MSFAVRNVLPVLALALVCVPAVSWADDEPAAPPAPTVAERFAAQAATFPAPSAKHAMVFTGEVKIAEVAIGTMRLEIAAVEAEGGAVWKVSERTELLEGAFLRENTALLDRALQPISGSTSGREPDLAPFEVVWRAVDGGWEIKRTETPEGGEALEPTTTTVTHDGPVTTSMTAFCLLSRLVLPAADEFELALLNPEEKDEDSRFEAAKWKTATHVAWEARIVWAASGTKGDGDGLELYFEPDTKELLAIRVLAQKGRVMEVRAVADGPVGPDMPDDDLFARKAESAEEAALQAAFSFAVADLKLLEQVVHWPSIHAVGLAQHEAANAGNPDAEPFPDEAGYRALLMEQLEQQLVERPRPMIAGVLKGAGDQLKREELDTGEVRMTFPEMFKSLQLVVKQVDGQWYLSRMPE